MQNSLYVQVLHSPILAALLHGTRVVGVSQTVAWYEEWNYETFRHGATIIRQGGHHVGYRPTFQVLFFDTSCDICAVSTLEHDTYFMLLSRTAAVYECVCLYAMQA